MHIKVMHTGLGSTSKTVLIDTCRRSSDPNSKTVLMDTGRRGSDPPTTLRFEACLLQSGPFP